MKLTLPDTFADGGSTYGPGPVDVDQETGKRLLRRVVAVFDQQTADKAVQAETPEEKGLPADPAERRRVLVTTARNAVIAALSDGATFGEIGVPSTSPQQIQPTPVAPPLVLTPEPPRVVDLGVINGTIQTAPTDDANDPDEGDHPANEIEAPASVPDAPPVPANEPPATSPPPSSGPAASEPIDAKLPPHIVDRLVEKGITTLDQVARTPDADLREIEGIGTATLRAIREVAPALQTP